MKYTNETFPQELFESKIDKSGEHWLWTGVIKKDTEYGWFGWQFPSGKVRGHEVHQIMAELLYGDVPEGQEVGHDCEYKHCVRHIRYMTHSENQFMRKASRAARGLPPTKPPDNPRGPNRKTHCKHNHEFTKENIYINTRGQRECKTCRRDAVRRRKGYKGGGANVSE